MFFVLAILSMLGFALLGSLMSYFSRKYDTFTIAFWRSISLVLVMAPFLFFAPTDGFAKLPEFLPQILFGGIVGALSFYLYLVSVRYLPVGVSSAFIIATRVLTLVALSLIFFQETLSGWEIVSIIVAISGVIILSFEKSKMPHLNIKTEIGILLTFIAGFLGAIWFFLVISTSRNLDPLLAAYFFESATGGGMILIYLFRRFFRKQKLAKLPLKTISKIVAVSSLSLIATGFYVFAARLGSAAVLGAIGTGSIVFITIFGRLFFKEKLKTSHYVGIAIIILGIVGLKIFG